MKSEQFYRATRSTMYRYRSFQFQHLSSSIERTSSADGRESSLSMVWLQMHQAIR